MLGLNIFFNVWIGDADRFVGNIKSTCHYPAIVGNSICNDETNNADCDYDGGDCCLSSKNEDYCSECECSTTGVINIPQQFYVNNLDLYWLIQVPSGQFIEFYFINFDVEDQTSCR